MMLMKRFILRIRLFLSTFFMKRNCSHEEKGFIYEFDDEDFRKLPQEEQAKEVQSDWNRYIKNK